MRGHEGIEGQGLHSISHTSKAILEKHLGLFLCWQEGISAASWIIPCPGSPPQEVQFTRQGH